MSNIEIIKRKINFLVLCMFSAMKRKEGWQLCVIYSQCLLIQTLRDQPKNLNVLILKYKIIFMLSSKKKYLSNVRKILFLEFKLLYIKLFIICTLYIRCIILLSKINFKKCINLKKLKISFHYRKYHKLSDDSV